MKHELNHGRTLQTGTDMAKTYRKEIVKRIIRNLLDVQLLRLVNAQPMWGYMIKKKVEAEFNVKLRHGAFYPTLNHLEQQGFLESQRQQKGGRTRKVYAVTKEGKECLQSYYNILKEQLECNNC